MFNQLKTYVSYSLLFLLKILLQTLARMFFAQTIAMHLQGGMSMIIRLILKICDHLTS